MVALVLLHSRISDMDTSLINVSVYMVLCVFHKKNSQMSQFDNWFISIIILYNQHYHLWVLHILDAGLLKITFIFFTAPGII